MNVLRRPLTTTLLAGVIAASATLAACAPPPANDVPSDVEHSDVEHADGAAAMAYGPRFCGVSSSLGVPQAQREALANHRNVEWQSASERADVLADHVDPRLVRLLLEIASQRRIRVTAMCTDHPQYSSSGKVSLHHNGRGVDVSVVDGQAVSSKSGAASALANTVRGFAGSFRPDEVGGPVLSWINWTKDSFTEGHGDHFHFGFGQPFSGSIAALFPPPAPRVPTPVAPTTGFRGVLSADFNGDGKTDLLGRTPGGDINIYPGLGLNGLNTFAAPTRVGWGWNMYDTILANDFNGDGKTDLLGRTPGGDINIYPGLGLNGLNTFAAPTRVGWGWNMYG